MGIINLVARWSLNDPSIHRVKVWDNTSNGHTAEYGEVKPDIITVGLPCGSRAMQWPDTGASIILPDDISPAAFSFWAKDYDSYSEGKWAMYLVSGTNMYVNGALVNLAVSVADKFTELKSKFNGGAGFCASDVCVYGAEINSELAENYFKVKTRISSEGSVHTKELYIRDSESTDSIRVEHNGVLGANSLDVDPSVESARFSQTGVLYTKDVVEE